MFLKNSAIYAAGMAAILGGWFGWVAPNRNGVLLSMIALILVAVLYIWSRRIEIESNLLAQVREAVQFFVDVSELNPMHFRYSEYSGVQERGTRPFPDWISLPAARDESGLEYSVSMIRDVLVNGTILLISGHELAGKTRLMYEAVKSLPTPYLILAPLKSGALPGEDELSSLVVGRDIVLILDELDQFVAVDVKELLRRLDSARTVSVIATCRQGGSLERVRSSHGQPLGRFFTDVRHHIEIPRLQKAVQEEHEGKATMDWQLPRLPPYIGYYYMVKSIQERRVLFHSLPRLQKSTLHAVLFLDMVGLHPISLRRLELVLHHVFDEESIGLKQALIDLYSNGWFIDVSPDWSIVDPEMAFINESVIDYPRASMFKSDVVQMARYLTGIRDRLSLQLMSLQMYASPGIPESTQLAQALNNQRLILSISDNCEHENTTSMSRDLLVNVTQSLELSQSLWFEDFDETAKFWFDQFLKISSIPNQVDEMVARNLSNAKQFDKLTQLVEKILSKNPVPEATLRSIASTLIRANHFGPLDSLVGLLCAEKTSLDGTFRSIILSLVDAKQYGRVADLATRLIATGSLSEGSHLAITARLLSANQYPVAISISNPSLLDSPQKRVFHSVVRDMIRSKQFERVEILSQQVIACKPIYSDLLSFIAWQLLGTRQYERVHRLTRRLLDEDPLPLVELAEVAKRLVYVNQVESALAITAKLMETQPLPIDQLDSIGATLIDSEWESQTEPILTLLVSKPFPMNLLDWMKPNTTDAGQFENADILVHLLLSTKPFPIKIAASFACRLILLGQHIRARPIVARLLVSEPFPVRRLVRTARILIDDNQIDDATIILNQLLTMEPLPTREIESKFPILLDSGDIDLAETIQKLIRINDPSDTGSFEFDELSLSEMKEQLRIYGPDAKIPHPSVRRLFRAKSYGQLEDLAEEMLSTHPLNVALMHSIVLGFIYARQYEPVEHLVRRLLDLSPLPAEVLQPIVRHLIRVNQYKYVQRVIQKLLITRPVQIELLSLIASDLVDARQHSLAQPILDVLLSVDPLPSKRLVAVSNTLIRAKHYDLVESMTSRILEKDPLNHNAIRPIASKLIRSKRYEQVEALTHRILLSDHLNEIVIRSVASRLIRANQFEQVDRLIDQILMKQRWPELVIHTIVLNLIQSREVERARHLALMVLNSSQFSDTAIPWISDIIGTFSNIGEIAISQEIALQVRNVLDMPKDK